MGRLPQPVSVGQPQEIATSLQGHAQNLDQGWARGPPNHLSKTITRAVPAQGRDDYRQVLLEVCSARTLFTHASRPWLGLEDNGGMTHLSHRQRVAAVVEWEGGYWAPRSGSRWPRTHPRKVEGPHMSQASTSIVHVPLPPLDFTYKFKDSIIKNFKTLIPEY